MSTIKVTWLTAEGCRIDADVPVGYNLMEAAVTNNVPGILGECGGALACATCHVSVEHSPATMAGPNDVEIEMLEMALVAPTSTSRLSCQVTAEAQLSGIVLRVPGP